MASRRSEEFGEGCAMAASDAASAQIPANAAKRI
jgi:hypothetical protein